jgi:dimethylaniline monooxygenase (N-oxide forming)
VIFFSFTVLSDICFALSPWPRPHILFATCPPIIRGKEKNGNIILFFIFSIAYARKNRAEQRCGLPWPNPGHKIGPFGIIAAKTYLELNPTALLTILETDTSLGGAWSKTRIYSGMYSQSPLGMIEFSDAPMKPTKDQFHGYVPAQHVYEYLEEYTKTHVYNGRDIKSRIRFDSRVTSIRKVRNTNSVRNSWVVCTDKGDVITGDKLMLATGITSKPNIPVFDNEGFTPPMLHTKDLARLAPSFVESEGVRNVVVLGGSKSAFDAVHMFLSAGKNLQWIIRDKGSGPAGMSAPDSAPVYYDNAHQILATRLMSKLSPCVFEPRDSWMKFFHQTKVGRWITDRVWSSMQSRWIRAAKYERSDNMNRLRPQLP